MFICWCIWFCAILWAAPYHVNGRQLDYEVKYKKETKKNLKSTMPVIRLLNPLHIHHLCWGYGSDPSVLRRALGNVSWHCSKDDCGDEIAVCGERWGMVVGQGRANRALVFSTCSNIGKVALFSAGQNDWRGILGPFTHCLCSFCVFKHSVV